MSALVTLVRHGRTAHNAAGRFQGWTDVPLDDTGHAQARLLAQRVGVHPVRPTRVYSSDLTRTRQTAEHLSEEVRVPVQFSEALREINIGRWEGRTFAEIDVGDASGLAAWPVRAAPEGETLSDVARRTRSFFDALGVQDGEHVVLVSHGVAITALLGDLLGWNPEESWRTRRGSHENTALSTLELDRSGRVTCTTLACAAHLESLRI